MADRDTSVMILPDGKLGKCEHFLDSHYIGSIYSDGWDFNIVNWFKQTTLPLPIVLILIKKSSTVFLKSI